MMEVLTKRFWQDVKKAFDEARSDPPPKDIVPLPPAEAQQSSQPDEKPPTE